MEWRTARAAWRERAALVTWLQTGPERSFRATSGHLRAPAGPNGGPVTAEAVLEALAADAAGVRPGPAGQAGGASWCAPGEAA